MFLRSSLIFLLAAALPLAGCEMLGGGDKGKDGESVGYACRVSSKLPEDCMKENNTYTPTSILEGWKHADKDVKEKKVDSQLGKGQPAAEAPEGAPKAEGDAKPEGEKPAAEAKPAAAEQVKH